MDLSKYLITTVAISGLFGAEIVRWPAVLVGIGLSVILFGIGIKIIPPNN